MSMKKQYASTSYEITTAHVLNCRLGMKKIANMLYKREEIFGVK